MLHHVRHVLCGGAARQWWSASRCQGGSSGGKPYSESGFHWSHFNTFVFYIIFVRLLVHLLLFFLMTELPGAHSASSVRRALTVMTDVY